MSSLPTHVGIIMDGNGRWAKERYLPRMAGHNEGSKVTKEIVKCAARSGIKYLSLFVFSTENWCRPSSEIDFLMGLLDRFMDRERSLILDNNIRFVVSGNYSDLPENICAKIEDLVESSKDGDGMVLNIALSYGGRQEIVVAAKRIALDVQNGALGIDDIDEDIFPNYLYNGFIPNIDLLIRTGCEFRVSNFMLWRIAYAELLFIDKFWPSVSVDDFVGALDTYAARARRFGNVEE